MLPSSQHNRGRVIRMAVQQARDELIETLRRIQRQQGWRDQEMAARIGISYAMWRAIRSGWKRPGVATLGAIAQAFPEIAYIVHRYLLAASARGEADLRSGNYGAEFAGVNSYSNIRSTLRGTGSCEGGENAEQVSKNDTSAAPEICNPSA